MEMKWKGIGQRKTGMLMQINFRKKKEGVFITGEKYLLCWNLFQNRNGWPKLRPTRITYGNTRLF
jgi:hypothetical protein